MSFVSCSWILLNYNISLCVLSPEYDPTSKLLRTSLASNFGLLRSKTLWSSYRWATKCKIRQVMNWGLLFDGWNLWLMLPAGVVRWLDTTFAPPPSPTSPETPSIRTKSNNGSSWCSFIDLDGSQEAGRLSSFDWSFGSSIFKGTLGYFMTIDGI